MRFGGAAEEEGAVRKMRRAMPARSALRGGHTGQRSCSILFLRACGFEVISGFYDISSFVHKDF